MDEQFVCDSAESANKYILDQGTWLPNAKFFWSDPKSVWEDESLKEIRDDLKKFLRLFLELVNSNPEHEDTRNDDEKYAREFLDSTCSCLEADAHACAMGFINYQSKTEPNGIRLWLSDNEGDRERARIFSLVEYKLLKIDQNNNQPVAYSIDVQYTPVVLRRLTQRDPKDKNDSKLIERIQGIDPSIEKENYQLNKLKTWSSRAEGYRITYITGESGLLLNMSHQGLNLNHGTLNFKYQDTIKISDYATFEIKFYLPFLSQEFLNNMKINERNSLRSDTCLWTSTDTCCADTQTHACGHIHIPFTDPSAQTHACGQIQIRIPSSDPAAPGDKSRGSDQILFYELFYELKAKDNQNYFVNLIICGIYASKVRRGQLTNSEALLGNNTPWCTEEEEPLINWIKSINPKLDDSFKKTPHTDNPSPNSLRELASNYSFRIVPEYSTEGKWTISYNKLNYTLDNKLKPKLDPRCCQEHEQNGLYELKMVVNPNETQDFAIENEIKIGTCERKNLFENCEIDSTIIANLNKLNWSPLHESSRQLLKWQSQLANEVNNSPQASLMDLFRIGLLTASDIVVNSLQRKILGVIQLEEQFDPNKINFCRLWPFNLSKLNKIVEDFIDAFLYHLDKRSLDQTDMVKFKLEIISLLNDKDPKCVLKLTTPERDRDKHISMQYDFLATYHKNLPSRKKKRELGELLSRLENSFKKPLTKMLIDYLVNLSHIALVIIDDTKKHNPFANLLLQWTPDILTQHMCRVVGGKEGPHCEMVIFSLLRLNLDNSQNKIQSIGISKESCALCTHVFASFGFKNYRSGKGGIYDGWRVLKWMVEGENLHLFLGKNNPLMQENYNELLKVYNNLSATSVNLVRHVSSKASQSNAVAGDTKSVLRGSDVALVLISMLGSFANDEKTLQYNHANYD